MTKRLGRIGLQQETKTSGLLENNTKQVTTTIKIQNKILDHLPVFGNEEFSAVAKIGEMLGRNPCHLGLRLCQTFQDDTGYPWKNDLDGNKKLLKYRKLFFDFFYICKDEPTEKNRYYRKFNFKELESEWREIWKINRRWRGGICPRPTTREQFC